MPIMIGGLQGSGCTTFANRAREYGITDFNIHAAYAQYMKGYKPRYTKLSGPHLSVEQSILAEFAESFPFAYKESSTLNRDLWYNIPLELLEWICDHTEETTVLITVPKDMWTERLYEREKLTDYRIKGKENSYELVKYEYEKLYDSRTEVISRLEEKVDYHIVNNGELGQYHAAIDNILNEHNLLN